MFWEIDLKSLDTFSVLLVEVFYLVDVYGTELTSIMFVCISHYTVSCKIFKTIWTVSPLSAHKTWTTVQSWKHDADSLTHFYWFTEETDTEKQCLDNIFTQLYTRKLRITNSRFTLIISDATKRCLWNLYMVFKINKQRIESCRRCYSSI